MKKTLGKTWLTYKKALPIIFGMVLLINLLLPFFEQFYQRVFIGNPVIDLFLGSIFGSLSAGMPVTAYIIGGELIKTGVSLLAVTAFTLTWTTVWLAFIPVEINCLGRKFAWYRNILNYFFALLISILTIVIIRFI